MEHRMSLGKLAAAAVLATASVGAAGASTFTFNDFDAYCVPAGSASPCADGDDNNVKVASQLAADSVFGVISPSFVDAFGQSFAARVTVVATGARAGAPPGSFTSNTVSGSNYWYHLRFDFVDSFDIEERSFGDPLNVAGLQRIVVDDIDSNSGSGAGANFTDVAAVNAPLELLGSRLEEAGFIAGQTDTTDLPTAADGFNYVRLAPTGTDDDGPLNWIAANNVPADASDSDKAAVRAVYDATGLSDGFDFVWGSTSATDFTGNTRGWNISLEVTPVPLPASLPLLLAAVAGLAWWKRRRPSA
ncbi:MAG: hypothetical protein ACOCYW_07670 [Roseicyclus sp.]